MIPDNAHAIIDVNGEIFDSWKHPSLIQQVTVELTTNKISEAHFRIFDPDFKLLNRFTTKNALTNLPMRFWLGFGMDLGEFIFKGLLNRTERNDFDTTLVAYDMGSQMHKHKKTGYHNKLSDVEIIKKLAERNGLKFEAPDKPFRHERHSAMMQAGHSDWELAMERAESAGLVLYVRGDTLYAKEPAHTAKTPSLTLANHSDAYSLNRKEFGILQQFDFTHKIPENVKGRPSEVEMRGRGRGGRRLTGRSEVHRRGVTHLDVQKDLEIHTKTYADTKAHARKQLHREHAFSANVRTIPPLPLVRSDVRDTVKLVGFGDLLSGLYLIDTIRHDLTGSGFSTDYILYRDIDE
jgi:phage protein D